MELPSPSPNTTVAALAFAVLAFFFHRSHRRRSKPSNLPPPPPMAAGRRNPLTGHLDLFTNLGTLPHVALGALANKHGPIFTIQLGLRRAVVVSSPELAKELFTTHDVIVSTRPALTATKLLGYNMVMFGFAPYGAYWREMRRLVTVELLSRRRVELMIRDVRVAEMARLVQDVNKLCKEGKVKVELKRLFGDMTLNVILRIVAGKRLFGGGGGGGAAEEEEARRYGEAIRGFFHYLGMFVMRDALPFLGWLDVGGHEKAMKRVARELDEVLDRWLEEHRRKRRGGGRREEEDFMDVMISVLDGANFAGHDPDVINKSACLNLIAGGTDTTTVTLTWAISLLLNNTHVLQKVYQELDKHVGKRRLVDDSDIPNLTYLQAIVKETLRLYPAAPLSGPREFTEDCTVAGYRVRKGTQLIVNIWKVQTDESVWIDPLEFRPERFLGRNDGDDNGSRMMMSGGFEYMAFGSGRRACPGMAFAVQMANLVLASFLHAFEVGRIGGELVDMTESAGLTNMKATPLEVSISPRLAPEVYG